MTPQDQELADLRKENKRLRMERNILKSGHLVRERIAVRLTMIDELREDFPVSELCRVLAVNRSAYYAWRTRPASSQHPRRAELAAEIREIHHMNCENYGSPRVHRELKARGTPCLKKTVAKIMRAEGIRAKTKKRVRTTTNPKHDRPVADNVLDRRVGSSIRTVRSESGVSGRSTSDLVSNALQMAIDRELPGQGLVVHSDRGSQYACEAYQQILKDHLKCLEKFTETECDKRCILKNSQRSNPLTCLGDRSVILSSNTGCISSANWRIKSIDSPVMVTYTRDVYALEAPRVTPLIL